MILIAYLFMCLLCCYLGAHDWKQISFYSILFYVSAEVVRSQTQIRRGPPLRRFNNNRVRSNVNNGLRNIRNNGHRNSGNNGLRKNVRIRPVNNGNRKAIFFRNKGPINNKNNGQEKYMIDIQAFVNLINKHMGRNNNTPPTKVKSNGHGSVSQPFYLKNAFYLPVDKHPAILTRPQNSAHVRGHNQNQSPNIRSIPPLRQIARSASPAAANRQLIGNDKRNVANAGNANLNSPNGSNAQINMNRNIGNGIINENVPKHGNNQNTASVNGNGPNNANGQSGGNGNTNGQRNDSGNVNGPNKGNGKGKKKPFDNYFQELQSVVNQMLTFDASPVGGGSQASSNVAGNTIRRSSGPTGGSNDSVTYGLGRGVPVDGKNGGRNERLASNNKGRSSLLLWAQTQLNGDASGAKQTNGKVKTGVNSLTRVQNNENRKGNVINNQRQLTGNGNGTGKGNGNVPIHGNGNAPNIENSNRQNNKNGNVNRSQNNVSGNESKRINHGNRRGIEQNNGTVSGNGNMPSNGNNVNNGNTNNNSGQSISQQTGTTNNAVKSGSPANIPPTKKQKGSKRKGRKGGRSGKGGTNKEQNADREAGAQVENANNGQQSGNGGNGNSTTQQSSQTTTRRRYMTYPPCPEAPCCGSDGRSYMSECYMD